MENCKETKVFREFEEVIQFAFTGDCDTFELDKLIDELQFYLVVYSVKNRENEVLRQVILGKKDMLSCLGYHLVLAEF